MLTCEICGGPIRSMSSGVFVCVQCGVQYDRERIREMAAESRAAVPVPEVPQVKKNVAWKKLLPIAAAVAAVLLLLLLLPGQSGEKAETPATEPAVYVEPADPALEDLQGLWYYEDPEIGWHEELYLWEGNAAGITWLESAPDKANIIESTYEAEDGKLYLYTPKTDYTAVFEYEYQGGTLVLRWYIDSGRGAGTYRVFEKRSYSQAPKTYIPRDKSTTAAQQTEKENVTSDMRNALRQARQYLDVMPFSREGLIDQLQFDGYGYTEAVYAVDNCGADWYEQAVLKAESYLQVMAFSRQGLIDQLQYEGFLYDQAVYGVEKAY